MLRTRQQQPCLAERFDLPFWSAAEMTDTIKCQQLLVRPTIFALHLVAHLAMSGYIFQDPASQRPGEAS